MVLARLEAVHAVGDRPGIVQQCLSMVGKLRVAAATVEEIDAQLHFQIRQGLAHHGLCPAQLAPGGGKAPFLGGGNKRSQLAERHPVQRHLSLLTMVSIEIYRLLGWKASSYPLPKITLEQPYETTNWHRHRFDPTKSLR
jgi:hypothetical protein